MPRPRVGAAGSAARAASQQYLQNKASKREFKEEFALLLLCAKKFFPTVELWLNNLA